MKVAVIFMILLGAAARLVPHAWNFTPIAAMALFGGVYLDKKYAIIIPLAALFLSDLFLGFNQSMPYVYGSFIITGLIGMWLRTHKTFGNIVLGTLVSSIIFFLVTNFGFWLAFSLYPKTWAGQMEAYLMALPFFRNTLLGDLFYTGAFFGAYEFMKMLAAKKSFTLLKKYI
jgi:hypothetical protein